MKAAFLDRDGTINQNFWQHAYEGGPDSWNGPEEPVLLPGTIDGMRHLTKLGYSLFIITNQYPIGEGQISQEFYDAFMEKLLFMLKHEGIEIQDVFFCPHRRDAGCACMKPRPGMILRALEKYPEIDMKASFFAGDSKADEGIAEACGIPFYGVKLDCKNRIEDLGGLVKRIQN